MKQKNKNYLLIGVIIVVIIFVILILSNSNKNSLQNEVTCNSPYIKVGTSCCLDQNNNKICDTDEKQTPQEQNWTLTDFKIFGTRWFDLPFDGQTYGLNFDTVIPEYPSTSTNIDLALRQVYYVYPYQTPTWRDCDNYGGALIAVTSDVPKTDYDKERVSCVTDEYYDGLLNSETQKYFEWTGAAGEKNNYGFYLTLGYEPNKKPSQAKYVVTCTGETSKRVISKTFTFDINYLENITVKSNLC